MYEFQEQSIPIYTSPGFQYERNGPEKDQVMMRHRIHNFLCMVNKTQEAALEHEFENIIYGYEPEVNVYSVISDPTSTTAV